MPENRLLHVGLAFKKKRFDEFIARGIFTESTGLQASWIDLDSTALQWPTVDVLLHKVSDAADRFGLEGMKTAMQNIGEYMQIHQSTALVDSCSDVSKVLDRVEVCELLQELEIPKDGQTIKQPSFIKICKEDSVDELEKRAKMEGLSLPCIFKVAPACGIPDAHQMSIFCSWAQLKDITFSEDGILQAFHNHGGILHKVYVIGRKVQMVSKPSLPDLAQSSEQTASKVFQFDSLDPSAYDNCSAQGNIAAIALNTELVVEAVSWLRNELSLTLFGFDVIVAYTGQHFIVDVNYFPSFKEVETAAEDLADALRQSHADHQKP